MAKNIVKRQPAKTESEQKPIVPKKYQDTTFIVLIAISIFVFFISIVFGNEINTSDNIASISMHPYLDAAAKSGHFPLWLPYIFCGLPGYASLFITGNRFWDLGPEVMFMVTKFFGTIFNNDSVRVIMFYVIYGIGMYLLMQSKKFAKYTSFFVAIAAVFSTGIIHWVMIGHNTKPIAIAMLPFVFLFMERLRERFTILDSACLILFVHLLFASVHLQMIFYSFCAIGIYLAMELINRMITKNKPLSIVRVIVVLAIAGGMAFAMSSDRYLSTKEYTQYSVRGSAPITQTKGNKVDDTGGNSYEYATGWSFSPQEMMTFIVPNYYGFGKLPYSGPATGGKEVKLPTYWGQKPFEDAAPYMGIMVFLLAFLGFWTNRKDVFVQALMVISIFVLILSFGNNMPLLYDFFFYHVPNFNKFRAPSMALAMMQFAFPILAGYGLKSIFGWHKSMEEKDKKALRNFLIASGLVLVIGLFYAVALKSVYMGALHGSDNAYFRNVAQQLPDVYDFLWGEMITDWIVIGIIAVLFAGTVYMYVNKKITGRIFFVAAALLLIFDLWRVDYRPLEKQETNMRKEVFRNYDFVNYIKQDKSKFRIVDNVLSQTSPNLPAYYMLESVGGYHPAKLRVFQDLLDVADQGSTSAVTNPFLWRLMNVKYIIYPKQLQGMQPLFQSQQTQAIVYEMPDNLPRAFFVDSIATDKSMEILSHLKAGDFEPRKLAYLEENPASQIEPAGDGATAEITKYENEDIQLKVSATGNNFLFLSEIYYPAGWTAYIDGKKTKIYKTNFAFRGVIIPKGNHELEMKFYSPGFEKGKTFSIMSNIGLVALFAIGIILEIRRKKTKPQNEED